MLKNRKEFEFSLVFIGKRKLIYLEQKYDKGKMLERPIDLEGMFKEIEMIQKKYGVPKVISCFF